MLDGLLGSQSVQKILLFLFVNGKCYGTQLQRQLNTSLTPVQKALLRLEKGGVVMSYYEGKTRLYQFDPGYPLLEELELLLKKAYTLLPAHEKKDFFVTKDDTKRQDGKVLLSLWKKLGEVRRLTFNAKSRSKDGWNGKGKGEVVVTREKDSVLLFAERGSWHGKQGEVCFSNTFRWTLDQRAGVISLEHLRRGPDHPVFLFHLAPSSSSSLASVDSHLCGSDAYFGKIFYEKQYLRLNWRVIGPRKNEEIDYYYL